MNQINETEKNNLENKPNENTESSKRKRVKPQPIAAIKPSIADKVKSLRNQGFDIDRIAAMLMIQKSLVKDILG